MTRRFWVDGVRVNGPDPHDYADVPAATLIAGLAQLASLALFVGMVLVWAAIGCGA